MKRKVIKGIVFLACIVVILINASIFLFAQESTTTNYKTSVFRVLVNNTYEADETGIERCETLYGTGFMVVDEETGVQYIITSYDIVANNDIAKSSECQVIVKQDITISAKLKKPSKDLGISIWELSEAIYDATPLMIYDGDENIKFPETVTLMGYDSTVAGCQNISGQIISTSNEYGLDYIYHDIVSSPEMLGGPIVNSKGQIIGVNINKLSATGGAAVSIRELTAVFDSFGIKYTSYKTLENEKKSAENKKKLIIIIASASVGTVLVLILIIFLATRKKRKEKKEKKKKEFTVTEPAPVFEKTQNNMPDYMQIIGAAQSRAVNTGELGTCILTEQKADRIYYILERVKNGERIEITKKQMVIGKDPSQTDYYIAGNNAISRVHSLIVYENNKIYVSDKNTTNGTFINGERIQPYVRVEIKAGDRLTLADETFVVYK